MTVDRHGPFGRRGLIVRLGYLAVAVVARAADVVTRRAQKTRTVLAWHGVRDDQKTAFERQMAWLGSSPARHRVELAFDDGFANLLTNAAPILNRHGLAATAYIVTGQPDQAPAWLAGQPEHPDANEPLLGEGGVRSLVSDFGWTIGAHTVAHPDLTACDDERMRFELEGSMRTLEATLGCGIDRIAFPHGRYDDRVLRAATETGYQRADGLSRRRANRGTNDGLEVVHRISMSPETWMIEFRLAAWGAYDWLIPWRTLLHRVRHRRATPVHPTTEPLRFQSPTSSKAAEAPRRRVA